MVDPSAHGVAAHQPSIIGLQQFGQRRYVLHSRIDGKDISGQFVFMDLLKKRAGKWVIVRTLGARVS
jgi:hypothetical protein